MKLESMVLAGLLLGTFTLAAHAQEAAAPAAPAPPEERIAAVKESFAASKAALKQYQWIESMAVSLGGEEKVRQQYTCYYGAEGSLQKVPVAADAKEQKKRGIRGKIVESKKAEMKESFQDAVKLLRQYAPLEPAKIQAAKDAGNVSVSIPGPDGAITVTIKNYLKPGDQVAISLDGAKNVLKGVAIDTYTGDAAAKEKEPVSAKVNYGSLTDGTIYPAKESIGIAAQGLAVTIENSGYKKQG